MKKRFTSLFLPILFATHSHARISPEQQTLKQDQTPEQQQQTPEQPVNTQPMVRKMPNYGTLMIDWGFDFLQGAPKTMETSFWGSRLNNICLYYNIRIMQSHFTVGLGAGLGREGYQFTEHGKEEKDKDYYTLVRDGQVTAKDDQSRKVKLVEAKKVLTDSNKTLSSAFDMTYLDFLLEARFNTNRRYPKEGFFIAIGGKLGILWSSSTTVYYKEDNQTKQRTTVENFCLKNWRYGAQARIGWNRLGLLYAITFSPLFSEGQGPEGTEARAHSAGISIDLF